MLHENNLVNIASISYPNVSNTKVGKGRGKDAQRIYIKLHDFDIYKSEAWNFICKQFSCGITHHELLSIAQLISQQTGLRLNRDESRDNRLLIKWYSDNWTKISPLISMIHIRDDQEQIIDLAREIRETSKLSG